MLPQEVGSDVVVLGLRPAVVDCGVKNGEGQYSMVAAPHTSTGTTTPPPHPPQKLLLLDYCGMVW
jgi:hypothetical protein